MATATLDRSVVEQIVRNVLQAKLPTNGQAKPGVPNLVVNISARHAHVTQQDLEQLFGAGHQLTPQKYLYQDGFFAAAETVTIIGPRNRIIPNVRILGPCRDYTQVELALTDAISLGIDAPVRKSGNHTDTPGAYLMGPNGMVEMKSGVIRHERHVHIGPADAAYYGVKNGDRINLRVKSDCATIFEDLLVRLDPQAKLEVHIDTDEGNACHLTAASKCELFV